jgi:hypothetical protein
MVYGDATEKDWVEKKKQKKPAERCSTPAKRWQEPNPFSGRGFIRIRLYLSSSLLLSGGVW